MNLPVPLRQPRHVASAAPVLPPLARRANADAALRQREGQWWQAYADAEERFSWVLPEAFQPLARQRYMREIGQWLSGARRVVDYGCGNGWVLRMLRRHGLQAEMTGVDFSAAQIDLARKAAQDHAGMSFSVISGPQDLPPADAYVFHGVLHHLAADEIYDLMQQVARRATPGARLVFVEPACFPGNTPDETDQALLQAFRELNDEPAAALRRSGKSPGPVVSQNRAEADQRWWGELPYGPSPMERPFERHELLTLVEHYFEVDSSRAVQFLPASQGLGVELTLLAEDDPALAAEIQGPLQESMDLLERALLKFPEPPDDGWYMTMTLARVR